MTDRLAELEARALALNAEIAALRAGKPAPVPPVRDEGARVVPILPEPSGLPTVREMEKLFAVVRGLSPWPSADKYDDTRPLRGFTSAFRWLQSMPRSDRPNGKVALSFWNDCCKNWLRDRGSMTGDLSVNGLVLACLAAGDVCYCPGNPQLGVTWEIGVVEYSGRPADATAWRRVLREGASAVLPPSAPARRSAAPSPVRIYGG